VLNHAHEAVVRLERQMLYLLPKALTFRPKPFEQKATKGTKALSYLGFFVLFVTFCSTKPEPFNSTTNGHEPTRMNVASEAGLKPSH